MAIYRAYNDMCGCSVSAEPELVVQQRIVGQPVNTCKLSQSDCQEVWPTHFLLRGRLSTSRLWCCITGAQPMLYC